MTKEIAIPKKWGSFGLASVARLLVEALAAGDTSGELERARAGGETIELPGYGQIRIALSINVVGDTCLRTNLVTKRAVAYSSAGDVIEIITDNPSSMETIPFMAPNYNFTHLATLHDERCWRLYIRKD